MKKLLLFIALLMASTFLFAKDANLSVENRYYIIQEDITVEKEIQKEISFEKQTVIIYAGVDLNGNLASLSISSNIGKENIKKLKAKVLNGETCVTRCTRANSCADKGDYGSLLCGAECVIDCAAKAIKELLESDSK